MGNTQTRPRLDIYLLSDKTMYPEDGHNKGYTVTPSKGLFQDNKKFQEITHRIHYSTRDPKKFDIYVYNTKGQRSDYSFNFLYYSLWDETHIVDEVKAYYPFFPDQMPLIIHIKMRDRTEYKFRSDDLRGKWFVPYFLYKHDLKTRDLNDQLEEEFDKLLKGNELNFTAGTANEGAMAHGYNIDSDNYHKAIYIPRKSRSNLGSDCLSKISDRYEPICEGSGDDLNKIDKYFLKLVDGDSYIGIRAYFDTKPKERQSEPAETPEGTGKQKDKLLLLEFVEAGGSKTYIKRMDVDGNWWSEDLVRVDSEQKLEQIKSTAERNDVNVVIFDHTGTKYKGLQSVTPDTHESLQAYQKYTYEFEHPKKPVTIHGRQKKIDKLNGDFKTKNVEVYYLKAKLYGHRAPRQTQDREPFLIVFHGDKTGGGEGGEKIYHFGKKYGLENWSFEKINGIKV